VAEGALDVAPGADRAATTRRLLDLPGVGPWTAGYVAMRALGDPDAFPAGDVALARSLARLGRPVEVAGLASHSSAWRPWRAYATVHLWSAGTPSARAA
jgi:AraC family transcriptional regulator of adaptative response / DNA-3-methyladenine glycosylase II